MTDQSGNFPSAHLIWQTMKTFFQKLFSDATTVICPRSSSSCCMIPNGTVHNDNQVENNVAEFDDVSPYMTERNAAVGKDVVVVRVKEAPVLEEVEPVRDPNSVKEEEEPGQKDT